MNKFKLAIAAVAIVMSSAQSFAADSQGDVVPQLVHCGIKDGKMKEYGTKAAAEADGATNIVVKTGDKCPELK